MVVDGVEGGEDVPVLVRAEWVGVDELGKAEEGYACAHGAFAGDGEAVEV